MKRLSLFVAFLFALTIGWVSSSYKPISDKPATVDLRSTIELPVENHAFVKVLDLDINKHTTYQNIDFDFVYTSFIFEISRDADFVSTTYTTKEKRGVLLGFNSTNRSAGRRKKVTVYYSQYRPKVF